ncbi:MAG: RHS repeat-associated core domain-containing protein [Saprospiraceae bacterium]|nr:RHS repeat-associated core domain-containing protein [Saprospiraceae bacterium]
MTENTYFITDEITQKHNYDEVKVWIDDNSFNISRSFKDGFGKIKQSSISEPSKNRRIIQTNDYDLLGRLKREYNTLGESGTITGNKATQDYENKLTNLYGISSVPYKEYDYLSRPEIFNSVLKHQHHIGITPFAEIHNNETYNSTTDVDFASLQYPAGELLKTIVTDENQIVSERLIDKYGNIISTKNTIGHDYSFSNNGDITFDSGSVIEFAQTLYTYDGAGNNISVIDPEGIITSKTFNSLGQILSHYHPDKGLTEYRYNKFGQLRFIKDAKDESALASNNYVEAFTYFKYDNWNRLIEVGKYYPIAGSPVWNSTSLINDSSFPEENSIGVQLHKKWFYDGNKSINANGRLWKEIVYSDHQLSGQQYSPNTIDVNYFEYNKNGQTSLVEYELNGLANKHAIAYTYNRQKGISQTEYRNYGNQLANFIEKIEYDDLGRIINTSSGHDFNSLTTDSKFTYDAIGKLKSTTLAEHNNKETISLQYDIRNRLVAQVSENFRYKLDYDLKSNIIGQTWTNEHFDVLSQPYMQNKYDYYYDSYNRLIGANYSQLSSTNFPFQNYSNLINSILPDFNCTYRIPKISEVDFSEVMAEYSSSVSNRTKYTYLNKAFKLLENKKLATSKIEEGLRKLESELGKEKEIVSDIELIVNKHKVSDKQRLKNIQSFLLNVRYNGFTSEAKEKIMQVLNQNNIPSTTKINQIKFATSGLNDDIVLTKGLFPTLYEKFKILVCTLNPAATNLRPVCDPLINPSILASNKYDTQYRYSKSGNILNLKRNNDQGIVKELRYSYQNNMTPTNKLDNVEHWSAGILGFTQTFAHDPNGNLLNDNHNSYSQNMIINPFNMIVQAEDNSNLISKYRYDINNKRIFKSLPNSTEEYYIGHVIVNQLGNPIQYGITTGYVHNNFTKEYTITDWLGSSRLNIQNKTQITHARDHYPYGLLMASRVYSNNLIGERYQFTGHEYDSETSYDYHGARYYNRELGKYLSVDPLADAPLNIGTSPYAYVWNNPLRFSDPTGMLGESTHLDEKGKVIAVFNDGDNGVYQHGKNADGGSVTEYQLSQRSEKQGTSSGGTKVGETEHWDEFVSPETGKTMTNYVVQIGKSFDPIISEMSKKADGMGLYQIAQESRPRGDFDIKGPYANVGGLLNGKYATSRSAGNYLAGYNANNGVINYTTFQTLAGKLHQQGFSTKEAIKTVLYGDHIGTAPTYGENMYQYRMSIQGWSDKGKTGAKIDMNQFKRTPTNGLKW